jgi:hypothetical protein
MIAEDDWEGRKEVDSITWVLCHRTRTMASRRRVAFEGTFVTYHHLIAVVDVSATVVERR